MGGNRGGWVGPHIHSQGEQLHRRRALPRADQHVHTIELDVPNGPDAEALQLLQDANAGAEAIALLEDGRVLVAKQKDPALLIEFGMPRSHLEPFTPCHYLARQAHFQLSADSHTRLVPLRSWQLRDEHNKSLESVNDLAVASDTAYAISSKGKLHRSVPVPICGPRAIESPAPPGSSGGDGAFQATQGRGFDV